MAIRRPLCALMVAGLCLASVAKAMAAGPDVVRVVGSSTVYPMGAAVAEAFGRQSKFRAPVLESTGTGGGIKAFCAGIALGTPDVVMASRPMEPSEQELCRANDVLKITRVAFGLDGVVLANARGGPQLRVDPLRLWEAIAKTVVVDGKLVANPYRYWNEIDLRLPKIPIRVYGPPPTSGTRDILIELVMRPGCEQRAVIQALPPEEKKAVCGRLREDGLFIEAGEDDEVLTRRLQGDPEAFGLLGFGIVMRHPTRLQAAAISGVEPSFETIENGSYPLARRLFLYVKDAHLGLVAGLQEFLTYFTGEAAIGDDGYLIDKGLIPLPEDDRYAARAVVAGLAPPPRQ